MQNTHQGMEMLKQSFALHFIILLLYTFIYKSMQSFALQKHCFLCKHVKTYLDLEWKHRINSTFSYTFFNWFHSTIHIDFIAGIPQLENKYNFCTQKGLDTLPDTLLYISGKVSISRVDKPYSPCLFCCLVHGLHLYTSKDKSIEMSTQIRCGG